MKAARTRAAGTPRATRRWQRSHKDRQATAVLDFENEEIPEDSDEAWKLKLLRNENGDIRTVITNAALILENDPALQGIRFNELSGAIEVKGKLPWNRPNKYWRDADDAQLYIWVADKYKVQFPENKFAKALTQITDKRRFNPLRDYIRQLPEWDGVPRVDTLLVDYLGAEDTPYVRAVTRKTLIGAIQRVWEPGCKFDTVLVLDGKPGIGKSTLLRKLGGKWFSDSLSLADTRDKTAAEKLQGVWIMEIGEMQGTRKADIDVMKGFLSRQVDEYRAAYGHVVERHPRTAIICGTTNSTTGFLRDATGNRRFWPVSVDGGGRLSVWEMTEATRAQIWAEAAMYATEGEDSFLDAEMEKEAARSTTSTPCCRRTGTAGTSASARTTSASATSWIRSSRWAPCSGRRSARWRSSASASARSRTNGQGATATRSRASWPGCRSGKDPRTRP